MVSFPYVVNGTIIDGESNNPNGAKVIMRNDRTGEKINTTTNSSGQYLLDAANLESGYMSTDRLTIICAFGDEENEDSFLISDYAGGHTINLTLVTIAESSDVTYCQVQDVLDELGDKTTDDISYERVRKTILRAESEIDEKSDTSFSPTLILDEEYDFNQYTSYKSPEQLAGMAGTTDMRYDYMNTWFNNKVKLAKSPLVNPKTQLNGDTTTTATTITVDSTTDFPSSGTIFIYNSTNGTENITYTGKTSTTFTGCTRSVNSTTATAHVDDSYVTMITIARNLGGANVLDSWTDMQPQVGAGGDFITVNDTALVTFVNNTPDFGMRNFKAGYSYGYITVPKIVERLAILLSVKSILTSTATSSQFDSTDSIALEGISISKNTGGAVSYLGDIRTEIKELWVSVGELVSKGV